VTYCDKSNKFTCSIVRVIDFFGAPGPQNRKLVRLLVNPKSPHDADMKIRGAELDSTPSCDVQTVPCAKTA
jgi:hypothetical protein